MFHHFFTVFFVCFPDATPWFAMRATSFQVAQHFHNASASSHREVTELFQQIQAAWIGRIQRQGQGKKKNMGQWDRSFEQYLMISY